MSKQNDFKTKLTELQNIVEWFEQDDLDIEQAITKFEAGVKLAEELKVNLNELENKITVLKERFDQTS